MDIFRTRLTDAITRRFDTTPQREELAQAAVEEIMNMVRDAIEKPTVSPLIDTWLVRTALGKQGERAIEARIGADGSLSAKPVDRLVEIYTRIYATERECGALPLEAEQRANRVLEGLTKVGVINGPQ